MDEFRTDGENVERPSISGSDHCGRELLQVAEKRTTGQKHRKVSFFDDIPSTGVGVGDLNRWADQLENIGNTEEFKVIKQVEQIRKFYLGNGIENSQ